MIHYSIPRKSDSSKFFPVILGSIINILLNHLKRIFFNHDNTLVLGMWFFVVRAVCSPKKRVINLPTKANL